MSSSSSLFLLFSVERHKANFCPVSDKVCRKISNDEHHIKETRKSGCQQHLPVLSLSPSWYSSIRSTHSSNDIKQFSANKRFVGKRVTKSTENLAYRQQPDKTVSNRINSFLRNRMLNCSFGQAARPTEILFAVCGGVTNIWRGCVTTKRDA